MKSKPDIFFLTAFLPGPKIRSRKKLQCNWLPCLRVTSCSGLEACSYWASHFPNGSSLRCSLGTCSAAAAVEASLGILFRQEDVDNKMDLSTWWMRIGVKAWWFIKPRTTIMCYSWHVNIHGLVTWGKTYNFIIQDFFWPDLKADVVKFRRTSKVSHITGNIN